MGYTYQYDQLNRIKGMHTFNGLLDNDWNNGGVHSAIYDESEINYDANGNIQTYVRSANSTPMDNLQYSYDTPNSNKLLSVSDGVGVVYGSDVGGTSCFEYDDNGNITKEFDNASCPVASGTTPTIGIEWTLRGKIKKITKDNGIVLEYTYDPLGNRVQKDQTYNGNIYSTYYVRDAQGNHLATYIKLNNDLIGTEHLMYGNKRLGIQSYFYNISNPPTGGYPSSILAGNKEYELTNHLDNVMATISDIRNVNGNGLPVADVRSAEDYYPFGMIIPQRQYSSGRYRFGFNGQEHDDEVKGTGNQIDFKFRPYDSRLGRFMSVDPLSKDYAWNSSYAFAENDVIRAKELEGAEKLIVIGGNDLPGKPSGGLSSTMLSIMNDMKIFSDANKLNYTVTGFTHNFADLGHLKAFQYLRENYKPNEPIIIYGYSLGAVSANVLAKMLGSLNIKVNLLVMVDPAMSLASRKMTISSNVDENATFYQTSVNNMLRSRGYASENEEGNDHTKTNNYNWDNFINQDPLKGNGAHGAIDEDSKISAEYFMKKAMIHSKKTEDQCKDE